MKYIHLELGHEEIKEMITAYTHKTVAPLNIASAYLVDDDGNGSMTAIIEYDGIVGVGDE